MKKIPFTKIIMAAMMLCNVAVIIFSCIMVWRTGDTSPLGWLLMGEGGALATWLMGYAWKEKVNKRNNLIERTFKLEGQMTECQHDIKDLKAYHKPT